MPRFSIVPDTPGIVGLAAGSIAVAIIISHVTGRYLTLPLVALGVVVGLIAVRSICR